MEEQYASSKWTICVFIRGTATCTGGIATVPESQETNVSAVSANFWQTLDRDQLFSRRHKDKAQRKPMTSMQNVQSAWSNYQRGIGLAGS